MTNARSAGTLAMLLLCAGTAWAQDGQDAEARSRELAQRMRESLKQQSKVLSRMQRDLERAARSDSRVRDSIVRSTSQQIAELAGEIARVQVEADRVQIRSVDVEARAQLRAQIASARAMANVTRALAGQQRALTFSTRPRPRGYLGVALSGEQNTELREGKVYTVFATPAVIASVTAGSPAARAGLEAGDTIVAFGREALPGAVAMADVMQPGERLPLRIRRRGSERVMHVVVEAERFPFGSPTVNYYDSRGGNVRICSGEDCSVSVGAPRVAPNIDIDLMPGMSPSPAPRPAPMRALAPAAGGYPRATWLSSEYSIAGATMTTITNDLEDLTGADEGILVLRVAPGTPAASSGLRGGDVIIRINDAAAETVRDLQQAVQRAASRGERRVPLVVSRKQRERSVTLQW